MIVKMKFLNISGPISDIDRVTENYLSKYEMQIENAITELKTIKNLKPFMDVNPYRNILDKYETYAAMVEGDVETAESSMDVEQMQSVLVDIENEYSKLGKRLDELKALNDEYDSKLRILKPFLGLDINFSEVQRFKFVKSKFGRVHVGYYAKFEKYLYDEVQAIFLEGSRDESYVYGCYFAAAEEMDKINSIFRSLHFENIDIDSDIEGTPIEIVKALEEEMERSNQEIEDLEQKIADFISSKASVIISNRDKLAFLSKNFDVRRFAAKIDNEQEDYYILCGWMSESDIAKFTEEVKDDDNITVIVEDEREDYFGEPPTKLQNPKILKPFEMFTEMYGLPSHDELDPTLFVALTYTFIFGAMFGDVGQGLCLFIGGGLLYLLKKIRLAGIISVAGIFSTFFGFMYGEFFGFEDTVIKHRWLSPMTAMTKLPLVGQLNTVFVVSVAFGMGLILFAMILNIINSRKQGNTEEMLFGANGVAGFIFYGFLVATIALYLTGHKTPGNIMLCIFLGIPVLMFIFKEQLAEKVSGKEVTFEDGIVMFLVQGFFELFETMLSFFSNTLSFVRIGAFAISHGAMMEVVMMLGGMENGLANANWLIIILGNILVCGLEGLVVGIQVLRLEYYEMFSRFYTGSGKEFKPYISHSKEN